MPRAISLAFAALFACSGLSNGIAAAYPDRPIRLIVPQAPGGSSDTLARVVAAGLGFRVRTTSGILRTLRMLCESNGGVQ